MRAPWLGELFADARRTGIALCAVGVALLFAPSLLTAALGLELIGAAFWWWARAAPDAAHQVRRWGWIRRAASALWLAFAIQIAVLGLAHAPQPGAGGALLGVPLGMPASWHEAFRYAQAAAIVWAGLELLAALPFARAFSDLPGPYLEMRSWLPVLLPAAGFALLWRQDAIWCAVPMVRDATVVLLAITALLAVLRAHGRRTWTACLRWLVVTDCALAALLVAGGTLPRGATLLLWVGAAGAPAFLLAGEMRGSAPRRGAMLTRLWRIAGWVALAALAWPTLVAHSAPRRWSGFVLPSIALTTGLAAWLSVARLHLAPERRRVMRPDPALTLSHIMGIVVLGLGPLALLIAWWKGFEPKVPTSIAALLPVVVGGWAAASAQQDRAQDLWHRFEGVGDASRILSRRLLELVVHLERNVLEAMGRAIRGMTDPLHDLHTGDAQEYLLFLIGLPVLAVVLPLLR